MLRVPINTELQHLNPGYDPAKAHDYYEKHKRLKGRQHGTPQPTSVRSAKQPPPNTKTRQKTELHNRIKHLEALLGRLEQLIVQKEAVMKRNNANPKLTAKKNAAAKAKNKPKTAAEKAKQARDAKKYRQQHKSQIQAKAKQASSGGGSKSTSSKSGSKPGSHSIAELRALVTKVKGQLAVAKSKLAAL